MRGFGSVRLASRGLFELGEGNGGYGGLIVVLEELSPFQAK